MPPGRLVLESGTGGSGGSGKNSSSGSSSSSAAAGVPGDVVTWPWVARDGLQEWKNLLHSTSGLHGGIEALKARNEAGTVFANEALSLVSKFVPHLQDF